jgi:hypothetical protein
MLLTARLRRHHFFVFMLLRLRLRGCDCLRQLPSDSRPKTFELWKSFDVSAISSLLEALQ